MVCAVLLCRSARLYAKQTSGKSWLSLARLGKTNERLCLGSTELAADEIAHQATSSSSSRALVSDKPVEPHYYWLHSLLSSRSRRARVVGTSRVTSLIRVIELNQHPKTSLGAHWRPALRKRLPIARWLIHDDMILHLGFFIVPSKESGLEVLGLGRVIFAAEAAPKACKVPILL